MKSILQSFRYLKKYNSRVVLNVFVTIIVAILEIVSLLSILPFLQIIFKNTDNTTPVPKPSNIEIFPIGDIGDQVKHHFNYWMYSLLQDHSKQQLLVYICIGVFLAFVIKNIFIYINQMIDRSIRYNVARDLRQSIYDKVLKLPIRYFSEQRRGDILTRFSNDTLKVESSVLNGFSLVFKEPVMVIFYLVSMLLISTKLTLFIFLLLPVLGFVVGRISKSLKRKSTSFQSKLGQLLSFLDETMFGAKVIKSFTAERYLYNRFSEENEKLRNIRKKIDIRHASSSPVSEILGIGSVMIVIWYGGSLILNNSANALTGEMLIAYLVLFSRMISPLKSFSDLYSRLQDGLASADRIDEFLAFGEEYPVMPDGEVQSRPFNDEIHFENMSFHYPNSDVNVLKNINFSVPKGSTVALVGQSGAGKSTIADLLPRFYNVTDGQIKIDGENINNIPLQELRSMFSYVSQEAILFNDTVDKNIRFGLEHKTDEEVMEASKIANAHDFIMNLENGYQTNVGERGSKLSGGQKQRITIARAILKNAPILILDEATSALDTESERLVQDAIEKLLKNRTAIVIAHRLSTIKDADQIYVIDDGEIIEHGTHDELLTETNGHYKHLTEMQAL